MLSASYAQVVEQGEPAVVYYSPKTTVVVDLAYTIVQEEPGIYAQYAEAMLGATDAVLANKTTYAIKDANILTMTSPAAPQCENMAPSATPTTMAIKMRPNNPSLNFFMRIPSFHVLILRIIAHFLTIMWFNCDRHGGGRTGRSPSLPESGIVALRNFHRQHSQKFGIIHVKGSLSGNCRVAS